MLCGLYGMKQAGQIWNHTLNNNILFWEFSRLSCKSCIYYHKTDTGIVIVAVHVDNFLLIASRMNNSRTSYGPHGPYLTLDYWDLLSALQLNRITNITQWSYHKQHSSTKLSPSSNNLLPHHSPSPWNQALSSGGLIGLPCPTTKQTPSPRHYTDSLSAVYCNLPYPPRPDIAYVIQQLSQYVDCYTSIHWRAATWLIRHLKRTCDMKLTPWRKRGTCQSHQVHWLGLGQLLRHMLQCWRLHIESRLRSCIMGGKKTEVCHSLILWGQVHGSL